MISAALGILIFILIWIAIPRVGSHPYPPAKATHDMINTLLAQLSAYKERTGHFPADNEGLSVLPQDLFVPGVDPKYRPEVISDAWATPFQYRLIDGKPRIRSAGQDGKFGTQDDITN